MDLNAYSASDTDIAGHYQRRPKRKSKVRRTIELPKAKIGGKFIKGPIPMDWLRVAAGCGQRAEAVAILLWYAAGWQKTNPAKLTPAILSELNVHPKTSKRCLQRMAEVGLVDVEFKRGRSPLVTLLDPKPATMKAKPYDDT